MEEQSSVGIPLTTPQASAPVQAIQIPSSEPVAPPPSPPKSKMPVIVGVILLFVLLILLGTGSYVMNMKKSEPTKTIVQKPTPSPTTIPTPTLSPAPTGTPTASVIDDFLSFTVPTRWTKTIEDPKVREFLYSPDYKAGGFDIEKGARITIELQPNENLQERVDSLKKELPSTFINPKPFSIGNLSGYSWESDYEKHIQRFDVQKGNDILEIRIEYPIPHETTVKQYEKDIASFIKSLYIKPLPTCEGLSEQACGANTNCQALSAPSCPTCLDMKFIECREKQTN